MYLLSTLLRMYDASILIGMPSFNPDPPYYGHFFANDGRDRVALGDCDKLIIELRMISFYVSEKLLRRVWKLNASARHVPLVGGLCLGNMAIQKIKRYDSW